jgi:predicted ABC-type sugar transport system permease subunit
MLFVVVDGTTLFDQVTTINDSITSGLIVVVCNQILLERNVKIFLKWVYLLRSQSKSINKEHK